ncbi:hypothetical protein UFOVP434_73 [uncultured Caudovirales phage]|uniref:Uncharacterized protein n=1 Tax=uncultured Caudovirales phage TaxID=2100421 RepID=A0A6J5MDG1_9CAUD|nr:hypothetical protein UFOVP434_73 [uncultured Caudovirales phage]
MLNELSHSNRIDEFYVLNSDVPMDTFYIGDIVSRHNREYQIVNILKECSLDYSGPVYKFRVQVQPLGCPTYSRITFTKTFPFKLIRRRADDARKVD